MQGSRSITVAPQTPRRPPSPTLLSSLPNSSLPPPQLPPKPALPLRFSRGPPLSLPPEPPPPLQSPGRPSPSLTGSAHAPGSVPTSSAVAKPGSVGGWISGFQGASAAVQFAGRPGLRCYSSRDGDFNLTSLAVLVAEWVLGCLQKSQVFRNGLWEGDWIMGRRTPQRTQPLLHSWPNLPLEAEARSEEASLGGVASGVSAPRLLPSGPTSGSHDGCPSAQC
ncbi:sulfated surface glycoprotein 185-like [Fukomys damarensis]|uniref:sulfated surface glycoprotein 185-like n=1 Tax=Fukomys damarensis TaxID=885580 RepID=UPI00145568AB|nr:sulfated surface glycoprotein 185-like [Fukomys damarensis]